MNTIVTFEELAKKFCQYISSQRRIKENPEKLTHIKQSTEESFAAFLKRFRDQYFKCQRPSDVVTIQTFKQNMLDKELWMHMECFPPHDMAELWEVAAQHADCEEHFQMHCDMAQEAQCQEAFKGDKKCQSEQGKDEGSSF